ncbi:MAG: hypothetical protein Q8M19_18350 [Reyranella sp.]|nr:hypothetical protein [Reyranella sp.]
MRPGSHTELFCLDETTAGLSGLLPARERQVEFDPVVHDPGGSPAAMRRWPRATASVRAFISS